MALILLKSSICLLAFLAFYKMFLERTSNHQFKRFYLLSVVLISIGIPFITFIEYIEPQFILGDFGYPMPNLIESEALPIENPSNPLPLILWSVYGIGVLLFSIRFTYNLVQILLKIKRNPKQKNASFISVLLQDLIVPHTFFSYIFLNKTKFENREIPNEVILHEETHVKQKHSLDIIFIELLQIVFWFNPLVYILKRDIKLNHEFLADQAVISQGVNPAKYQQILLAYSSHAEQPILAHAINYSLIKKRFTIMKTKSSKQSIWLRSFLLLPLLAMLIFGFSTTKQVEKDIVPKISNEDLVSSHSYSTSKHTARSIDIKLFNNGSYEIDGIKATKNTFVSVVNQLHQDITPETRNQIMNIHIDSENNISKEEIWFIYNSLIDYGFHRIVSDNQEIIREKGNKPFAITNALNQDLSENTIKKTDYSIPVLDLKQNPLRLRLNEKNTSLESLSKDFRNATNQKQSDLRINASGAIKFEIIKQIMNILDGNLQKIRLSENAYIEDNTDYSKTNNSQYQVTLPTINGIPCDNCKVNLSRVGIEKLILGTTSNQDISSFKIKFPGKPTLSIDGNRLSGKAMSYLKDAKIGNAISIFDIISNKISLKSHISIQLVIKHDKNYSHSPIVKKGDKSNIPPPPPPAPKVKKGEISNIPPPPPPPPPVPVNASVEQKEKYEKMHKEYNKRYEVNNGEVRRRLPPPPPPVPANATPEQRKKYKAAKADYEQKREKMRVKELAAKERLIERESRLQLSEERKNLQNAKMAEREAKMVVREKDRELAKKERELAVNERELAMKERQLSRAELAELPPPPPPPKSPLDHVIDMAKKGATFYYEGKKISSDDAISLLKANDKINISSKGSNGKNPTVHLSTKPIKIYKKEAPKPTAENIKSHIKVMNRHGASFYLGNDKITFEEALKYVKNHKDADVTSSTVSNVVIITP